jgi:acetylornithine/succinyldiaminopimelate/putrescine aminotransferase
MREPKNHPDNPCFGIEEYRAFVNPARIETLEATGSPLVYSKAFGSWLEDPSGRRFLDLVCGYGTATLGHRNPEVISALEKALRGELPFTYPSGVSPLAGELGGKLCDLAGRDLNKVYFGNSGTEGIEAALKFAMAHTGRSRFLSFDKAFHGFTLGALSLCGAEHFKAPFPGRGVVAGQVPFEDIDRVEDYLKTGLIAGVVVEPVQGMAGARAWNTKKLEELSVVCRRYGTVLILDEVLTGIGRTGKWFAFQHASETLAPDIVVVSKGLTGGIVPMCAVLMTDEIFKSVYSDTGRAGIHSSTFEGNLIAMAVGLAVIKNIEQNELLKRTRLLSDKFISQLSEIEKRNIGISGVRGLGLLLAFQVTDNLFRAEILWGAAGIKRHLLNEGVITNLAAQEPSYINLLPALTMSDAEINWFFSRLNKILNKENYSASV